MGRWPPFFSHWASLPEVVVLPEPCRPAMRITVGGCEANLKRAVSVPRVAMSSSRTIFTICSAGERAVATCEPRALARMFSMRSRATSRLTSDSRRATRISRRASLMFSSVRVPWPRRVLKERWSFSERVSNMAVLSLAVRSCADGERGHRWREWSGHVAREVPGLAVGVVGRENLGMNQASNAGNSGAMLREYMTHLRVEKGLRPLSCEAYLRDLEMFAEFLESER